MEKGQAARLAEALRTIYRRLDLLRDAQSQVTPNEMEFLAVLAESGPTRLKDLAEKVKLPLSTVGWTADRMVERKLLARKTDPRDRRAILLTPSGPGQIALRRHNALFDRLAQTALATLAPEERDLVIKAIEKIIYQL